MDSGEAVAFGAEEVAEVASDEEVSAVNGGVAVPAEKRGVGGAIERSLLIAKLTSLALHLHGV